MSSEWTTLRVRENTADDLEDRVEGKNMDQRIRRLLDDVEEYIDQRVSEEVEAQIMEMRNSY